MKHIFFVLALVALLVPTISRADTISADTARHEVLLKTTEGDIVIALFNETPLHRDNFLKLVRSGFYNGVLFHRVIPRFMIQTGDSASRHAETGAKLGETKDPYVIPAEIRYPKLFHKYGAVAAARESDDVNPQRASSASQFYIVTGQIYSPSQLDKVQERIDKATGGTVKLTPDVRRAYRSVGGTPHLDGQYTVFGEVVSGMEVVENIQYFETDADDRPINDVRILKATVIK